MTDRFARHELIDDWQQQTLTRAKVVLVGMGALGNEVARVLAMSGVGSLLLCDPDRIEPSNLSRTVLFRDRDVGRLKVEAAAEALADLAPGMEVEVRPRPLVHGVGLGELRDAALVIGCLDSRTARLQLAGRCQLVRAGYLDAGTHPWGGEVRPYLDPDGPCYSCALGVADRAHGDQPWSCMDFAPAAGDSEAPASAPSSALVGAWQAMVAIRCLMGLPAPTGILKIDAVRGTTTIVDQRRDPECPLHEPLDKVESFPLSASASLQELRKLLSPDDVPLAWAPVERSARCTRCDYQTRDWLVAEPRPCPNCGAALTIETTLELDEAPGEISLSQLGIPPREILTVRGDGGWRWLELVNESEVPGSEDVSQ